MKQTKEVAAFGDYCNRLVIIGIYVPPSWHDDMEERADLIEQAAVGLSFIKHFFRWPTGKSHFTRIAIVVHDPLDVALCEAGLSSAVASVGGYFMQRLGWLRTYHLKQLNALVSQAEAA